MRLITAVLCLFLASASAQRAWADPAPAPSYDTNLIVDGDAEENFGATDSTHVVKPASWETTGDFTVVQYGAKGEFPDISTPGPVARGLNLFEGGNTATSTATQKVSLNAFARDIDAGRVTYTLSAWLGGYGQREDDAMVTVTFDKPGGGSVEDAKVGPVDAARRMFNSGYVKQETTGPVPKGSRTATVTIVFTRKGGEGYNHGSADNVSLTLSKNP